MSQKENYLPEVIGKGFKENLDDRTFKGKEMERALEWWDSHQEEK